MSPNVSRNFPIAAGRNPNIRLFYALYEGRIEALQQFVGESAAIGFDWSLRRYRTLVNGHPQGLYDHKAPSRRYPGGTALHVAAWRGHANVVSWLLAQGASPLVEDAYGRPPADVAATPELMAQLTAAWSSAEPLTESSRPLLTCGCGCERPLGLRKVRAEDLAEDARECAVCYVTWSDGDQPVKMRPCGHTFCEECLGKWLQTHDTCPLCRAQIPNTRGCSAIDRPPHTDTIIVPS